MINSICTEGEECTKCQAKAAKHFKGPLLIVAGPGAGKTRVLVERVAYLIKNKKIDPSHILVITFTVKAAEELKARLSNCIGPEISSMQISTIHSFCHELLKTYSDCSDLGATFEVLDEEMQLMFIRSNYYKLGLKKLIRIGRLPEVIQFFNKCGENCISPQTLAAELKKRYPKNKEYQNYCHVYEKYITLLKEERKIDFPGLQQNVLNLLKTNDDVLKDIRERFNFILVDEYQDTNPIQDEFFNLISNPKKNICVVGDEDQSIYGFRGADPWNFMRFKDKYNSSCVTLDKNFRSSSNIVNLFDNFMEKYRHYPKHLESCRDCGNGIIVLKGSDVHDEAKKVVETIKILKEKNIIPHFGYVALLFRSVRYHAGKIIEELKNNDIPYSVHGHGSFIEREEIRSILYLLSYVDPPEYGDRFNSWKHWWNISIFETEFLNLKQETINALHKVPKDFDLSQLMEKKDFNNIGIVDDFDISKLKKLNHLKSELSQKNKSILQLFYKILKISGYLKWLLDEGSSKSQEKIFNLAKLSSILNKYERMNKNPKIKDFMWYLYLLPGGLQYDEEILETPYSVKILTVHQAKGLEFPVVFVCSVINNRFPGRKRTNKSLVPIPEKLLLNFKNQDLITLTEDVLTEDEHEMEERRLFYVAMTRAQDILVVSTANKINVKVVGYSPYIKEIEKIEKVLDNCSLLDEECKKRELSQVKPVSLSYSSIDTYNRCPFVYELTYDYGFQYPPTHSQNYGIILHNCLHKIHIDLKNKKIVDGARIIDIVDKCWIKVDENVKKDNLVKRKLERELLDYYQEIKEYAKEVKSTEEAFSITKKNMEINGRTDLIIENKKGEIELLDFKAREKKGIERTNVEFQLKMYEYALKDKYKFDKLCAYTFTDKGKTYFQSKEKDLQDIDEKLEDICNRINNHEFNPQENEFCSACLFKFLCDGE